MRTAKPAARSILRMRVAAPGLVFLLAGCAVSVERAKGSSAGTAVVEILNAPAGAHIEVVGADGVVAERFVGPGGALSVATQPGPCTVRVDGRVFRVGHLGPGDLATVRAEPWLERIAACVGAAFVDSAVFVGKMILVLPLAAIGALGHSGYSGGVHVRRLER